MASAKQTSPHEKFVASLTPEERVLLELRDELYGGSWARCISDLRNRLEKKPYIFKLVNRMKEDIERAEKLSEYEKKHHVNLADYLKKGEAR
jgi:hypothetical protein